MSLFRLFSGGSSDIEVRAGGTSGPQRSGRGQGGRGTRSGMSGDSVGAGSLSSVQWENNDDYVHSMLDELHESYPSDSMEGSGLQDDDVVGVEAEGDVSLHLDSESYGGEDLEWYSCAGNEAAYHQAATESHNANVEDGAAGGNGVVPAPFKGQGSTMYTYHECGKMRVGTLNIRGTLRGASEVCVVRLRCGVWFVIRSH